jgi:polyphenol oxidase
MRYALELVESHGVRYWTDTALREASGVTVGFTERTGGVSKSPYASLNLAAHVGDEPDDVDANRTRLMEAVGLSERRDRLTTAEQVHGGVVEVVGEESAGSGAYAVGDLVPLHATDALVTAVSGVPLMLCFADCVPIVAVVQRVPAVAVIHGGWRGVAAQIHVSAVERLCEIAGADASEVLVYIGPHIRACHYEVGPDVMSHFVNAFGTFARADSGFLDLEAVVIAGLESAGVDSCNIARVGMCTAEETGRFFSHRAEAGRTGRHAALACIR